MSCAHCPCKATCLEWPVFCEWAAADPPDPVHLRTIRERSAMGVTPAYPSAAGLARNLATDLWAWAVSGFTMATDEERARRLGICGACEFFDAGPRRCKHMGCGCFLAEKVKLRTAKCPVGKW